jgi:hypothetical protein
MFNPFSRVISAAALIAGPLSLIVVTLVQWMLQPAGAHPTGADVAAQFPAAWSVVALLSVFGSLVWIGGLPAVTTLVKGRAGIVTLAGALITGLGLGAGVGHLALYFGLYGALGSSGIGQTAADRVDAASTSDPLAQTLLIVFLAAFAAGPIVLTVGLRVARAVGVWVPIAAVITAGAGFFGGPVAGIVQLVTLVLVWAPVIVLIVRPAKTVRPPIVAEPTIA